MSAPTRNPAALASAHKLRAELDHVTAHLVGATAEVAELRQALDALHRDLALLLSVYLTPGQGADAVYAAVASLVARRIDDGDAQVWGLMRWAAASDRSAPMSAIGRGASQRPER